MIVTPITAAEVKTIDSETEEDTTNADDSDTDYAPVCKKMRLGRKKNTAFFNEAICAALDRYKVSSRAAIHILIPTLQALGHNVDDYIINRTTLQAKRSEIREHRAKHIKNNFKVINCNHYCESI